eukprot:3717457-Alexandrium_andersonii.AAC.1
MRAWGKSSSRTWLRTQLKRAKRLVPSAPLGGPTSARRRRPLSPAFNDQRNPSLRQASPDQDHSKA